MVRSVKLYIFIAILATLNHFQDHPRKEGGGGRDILYFAPILMLSVCTFFFFFFALFLFCFMTASGSKEICLSTDALSTSELLITIVKEIGRHCWGWGEEKPHCKLHNNSQPASAPALSMYCMVCNCKVLFRRGSRFRAAVICGVVSRWHTSDLEGSVFSCGVAR